MYNRRRKRMIFRLRFIAFVIVFAVAFFYADSNIRPIVKEAASNSAESSINNIVNQTVEHMLDDFDGHGFAEIVYDENNLVKSVDCDTIKLNRFKSQVNSQIVKAVSSSRGSVKMSVGTLMNNDYLMGRGPDISIGYDMSCSVTSEIHASFASAGINQTKHQLALVVTVKARVLIPWNKFDVSVETEIPIDETIIVGDVPNNYINFDSLNRED